MVFSFDIFTLFTFISVENLCQPRMMAHRTVTTETSIRIHWQHARLQDLRAYYQLSVDEYIVTIFPGFDFKSLSSDTKETEFKHLAGGTTQVTRIKVNNKKLIFKISVHYHSIGYCWSSKDERGNFQNLFTPLPASEPAMLPFRRHREQGHQRENHLDNSQRRVPQIQPQDRPPWIQRRHSQDDVNKGEPPSPKEPESQDARWDLASEGCQWTHSGESQAWGALSDRNQVNDRVPQVSRWEGSEGGCPHQTSATLQDLHRCHWRWGHGEVESPRGRGALLSGRLLHQSQAEAGSKASGWDIRSKIRWAGGSILGSSVHRGVRGGLHHNLQELHKNSP